MSVSKHMKAFRERHLGAGESIWAACDGYVGRMMGSGDDTLRNGALIVTDRRVVFYRKGFLGEANHQISRDRISAVEHTSTLGHHSLKIRTSNDCIDFKGHDGESVRMLIDAIQGAAPPAVFGQTPVENLPPHVSGHRQGPSDQSASYPPTQSQDRQLFASARPSTARHQPSLQPRKASRRPPVFVALAILSSLMICVLPLGSFWFGLIWVGIAATVLFSQEIWGFFRNLTGFRDRGVFIGFAVFCGIANSFTGLATLSRENWQRTEPSHSTGVAMEPDDAPPAAPLRVRVRVFERRDGSPWESEDGDLPDLRGTLRIGEQEFEVGKFVDTDIFEMPVDVSAGPGTRVALTLEDADLAGDDHIGTVKGVIGGDVTWLQEGAILMQLVQEPVAMDHPLDDLEQQGRRVFLTLKVAAMRTALEEGNYSSNAFSTDWMAPDDPARAEAELLIMKATGARLGVTDTALDHEELAAPALEDAPALDDTPAPTRFDSVREMYFFLRRPNGDPVFKSLASNESKIRVSPSVLANDHPDVIEFHAKMELVYVIFSVFIHTNREAITVISVPYQKPPKAKYLQKYQRELTVKREDALHVLRELTSASTFDELVGDTMADGTFDPDIPTAIFDRLLYDDQGPPGVDRVLEELGR